MGSMAKHYTTPIVISNTIINGIILLDFRNEAIFKDRDRDQKKGILQIHSEGEGESSKSRRV
jgi:hypothetical protein